MILPMPNVHRYTNRNYRPADDEYEPAKTTVEADGHSMNAAVRALLRLLNADPAGTMAKLRPHLRAIAAETPRGRSRRTDQP